MTERCKFQLGTAPDPKDEYNPRFGGGKSVCAITNRTRHFRAVAAEAAGLLPRHESP